MDFSQIKAEQTADPDLVNEGAWLDYGEFKLRVARWNNPRFQEYWQTLLTKPDIRRKLELDRMTPQEDRALLTDVMAHTILVGWESIEKDGKPLEVNPQNAAMLLEMDFLREEITKFARNSANYRARFIEDGVEALKKSSNGG